ncbi:MAG: hypothetical protein RIR62_2754 [Pseudomonadota bacterium]|jgi:hypothetical protein
MTPDRTEPTDRKAQKPSAAMSREERLKAALKANMARRKAQARARSDGDATGRDAGADDARGTES